MLVLTRKLDEKIQIGNDITITLIRVQGNTVRIGIDAPREIRVIRAELESHDAAEANVERPLSEREEAFAHPTLVTGRSKKHVVKKENVAASRESNANEVNRVGTLAESKVYMTRLPVAGNKVHKNVAPLAAFLQTDVNVGIAQ
ncbi:Carbon storage regulator [Novipirellula galeiformis]|uniref:Translational regulator CsrA n=1 Tax=Novipirellula galeiformis TaxID=2528004 RepID=A0A5C6CBR0_9BACT|nr:carbon storage regulator [Novipirellula galeiformis]TWU20259.1 Carbon storage regulator [Novipirellula galeiformis]